MQKIAIISSYGEQCGAAFYSSRLKKHFERYSDCQVDIKKLNVGLLRRMNSHAKQIGNEHINDIIDSLAGYNGICLQLEPGLYGSSDRVAFKRVRTILKRCANTNIVITIHGFRKPSSISFPMLVRMFLSFNIINACKQSWLKYVERPTIKFWSTVKAYKNIKVLSFCQSDATLLEYYYGLDQSILDTFPITYFSQEEIAIYKKQFDRKAILKKYELNPSKKYIAIFGFINTYKGHLTVLKTMELLPDDYELVIIGGEHPQAIQPDVLLGDYVAQLFSYLYPPFYRDRDIFIDGKLKRQHVHKTNNFMLKLGSKAIDLLGRVHFLGQLPDEEVFAIYSVIDYVVLPYMKTFSGQSASGPATFAMEFNCRAVFSNAPVFKELEKYFPCSMQFFNVGNFVELAEVIKRYKHFESDISQHRAKILEYITPKRMIETYLKLLTFPEALLEQ